MIDNQLILEALTSGSGFLVFFFMARIMSDTQLQTRESKDQVDLMVCVVVAFMWIRLFYFMFYSKEVSIMLITLLAMLWDVMEFLFIMVVYIIMATLFLQTLYQDRNKEYYTTI